MSRPLRIEYEGAFYHVTSLENERKHIFRDDRDRENFLLYSAAAAERYRAVIHVYCLMSNHYHLLVEAPEGDKAVKKTALCISHRFSGKSIREMGKVYGLSESGVSQVSSFCEVLESDSGLSKKVQEISERLGLSNV